MLDILILATEPFGTWGPGSPGPQSTWWEQTVSHPTIIAAFLGFFGGVLIKFLLEIWLDWIRARRARRIVATALRAELVQLDVECGSRVDAFEELLKEEPDKQVYGDPHSFDRMSLPPRRVWMAHLDRIGELEGVDPDGLILLHASLDSHDLIVETLKQRAGGQGVSREALQDRVDQLKRVRGALVVVGRPLIEQTKVGPSWWRRILRF